MKLSIIDIGTQSIKHYIFKQNKEEKNLTYYKRHSDNSLSDLNTLSAETIRNKIQILKDCLAINNQQDVKKLHIVGTEIFRKVTNAKDPWFVDRKQKDRKWKNSAK